MSLDIKDAVGLTKVLKTTLAAGEHTPHHIVDETVAVSGPLTDTQLRASAVPVALDNNSLTALENISVTFPSTQNVSVQNASLAVTAASLPLPSGAATSANQSTLIGHVDGIEGLLTTIDADTGSIDTKLPSLTAGGRIPVDIGGNSSITVTSGTITVQNEVEVKNDSGNPVPVSDNGSSLTVDGTVSSNLQDGSGNALTSSARGAQRALSVQIVDGSGNQITSFGSATVDSNTRDGSGNAITSTLDGSKRRLDVTVASAGTTGSTAPTTANLYAGTDGTNLRAISVDSSGRANVNSLADKGSVSEASTQSITTGGTHQQVFASNSSRKYLLIQNISDTDMYLGLGFNPSNTTPAGLLLAKSGGGIVFESSYIPTSEVRIVCATTGKRFVALQG